jgi:hypothetical protein
MGKSGKSLEKAQDNVLNQFSRDIYQESKRTWLNAVEQAIEDGKKRKAYQEKQNQVTQVYRSFYNPDSPLRGSSSWSKQQWEEYKEKQREEKRLAKLANKQSK